MRGNPDSRRSAFLDEAAADASKTEADLDSDSDSEFGSDGTARPAGTPLDFAKVIVDSSPAGLVTRRLEARENASARRQIGPGAVQAVVPPEGPGVSPRGELPLLGSARGGEEVRRAERGSRGGGSAQHAASVARVGLEVGVRRSYAARAFGHDELKPVSGGFDDHWGGVGMTLVDSLDTLWLLGLRAEFAQAAQWAARNLTLRADASVSVFEYNIRLLGGLLSAFELSGDAALLGKAREVGELLKLAFPERQGLPSVRAARPPHA